MLSHMTPNAMLLQPPGSPPPAGAAPRSLACGVLSLRSSEDEEQGEVHFTTAAPTPLTKLLNARPVVHASSLFGQGAPRFKPLLKPGAEELVQHVRECMLATPEAMGWKFGASLQGNRRRLDSAHYDPRWYDTGKSKVFAVGLTSNRLVQLLEQSPRVGQPQRLRPPH